MTPGWYWINSNGKAHYFDGTGNLALCCREPQRMLLLAAKPLNPVYENEKCLVCKKKLESEGGKPS